MIIRGHSVNRFATKLKLRKVPPCTAHSQTVEVSATGDHWGQRC